MDGRKEGSKEGRMGGVEWAGEGVIYNAKECLN